MFSMPSPAELFAMLLFSLIGMVTFGYGKRRLSWPLMGTGIALMTYSYIVSDVLWLYIIGFALCAAIYWFRE